VNNKRGRGFNCVSKERDVEERWCRRVVVLLVGWCVWFGCGSWMLFVGVCVVGEGVRCIQCLALGGRWSREYCS